MHWENAHMQLIAPALNIEKGENEIIRSIRDAQRCASPSLLPSIQRKKGGMPAFLFVFRFAENN